MSSELEPAIWSLDTGHIGILGGVDGRRNDFPVWFHFI